MEKAKQICPTTTMGKVSNGALIVDVRKADEVANVTFDVPNYINIPINELEDRLSELPKDKEIVMVCLSGERSLKTTYFLMNNGYQNVFNMDGGIIKWASKKFPTKGDVKSLLSQSSCDCSSSNCC
ncbi:rhodanese-like domain-containing protein [Yeosuana marina]|uniref:rhodanese-like domain-containing protein n=1 Tax=Yeosuana marina TaxID=1565536 RepID=UPI00141DE75B|nr:rhodanese-like domain-containing protein [Yeosuana marina]